MSYYFRIPFSAKEKMPPALVSVPANLPKSTKLVLSARVAAFSQLCLPSKKGVYVQIDERSHQPALNKIEHTPENQFEIA
jgi:hypothetical protein